MAGVFIQADGSITSAATPTQPKLTNEVLTYLQSASDIVVLETIDARQCLACGLYANKFYVSLISYGPLLVETEAITAKFSTLAKAINWVRKITSAVSSFCGAYLYFDTATKQRYRLCKLRLPTGGNM